MNEQTNPRFRRLATAAAFASLFAYAVAFTVTSASMNEVGAFFHATQSTLGWLFRALMISFFTGVICAGRFTDKHGKLHAIWPGCAAMAVGMILFAQSSDFRTAFLSTLLMGFGGGLSEGSAMALVSDLYTGARRMSMANWSQAAFSFGAIACPLGVGQLLKMGIHWQAAYYGGAGVCVIAGIAALSTFIVGREELSPMRHHESGMATLMKDRLLLVLAASIMLYVGAETGTGNWLAVYFKADLGATPSYAAWSVAVFWAGITLGRILAGWLATRISEVPTIRCGLMVAALFQALLLLVHGPTSGMAFVFLLGTCLGPIFPTIASCSGAAYPGQTGTAMGILVAAGSLGGAIFPPTVGVVADHTGMRMALWISLVVIALNLGAMGLLRKKDIARVSHISLS